MKIIESRSHTPVPFNNLEWMTLFRRKNEPSIFQKIQPMETKHNTTINTLMADGAFAGTDIDEMVYPLGGAYIENPCKECLNE